MDSQNKHQIKKNTNFLQSLGHAWDGINDLFKEERNFRFHTGMAILVILLGLILKVSLSGLAWLIFADFLVIGSETLNTVFENLVDLIVGHHYNSTAKRVKDIAAGGVLITSGFAAIIGCMIFIPAILNWFK